MTDDNDLTRLAVYFLYAHAMSGGQLTGAFPDAAGGDTREASTASPVKDHVWAALAERLARQETTADVAEIVAQAHVGRSLAAGADARSLTVTAYDRARGAWLAAVGQTGSAGERTWPPTSQTVISRLGGSWNLAMQQLGLPVSAGGRQSGSGRYTDGAMARLVAEFLGAGVGESFGAFGDWLQERKATNAGTEQPSAAAVRKRFGTWNAAKESAARLGPDGAG